MIGSVVVLYNPTEDEIKNINSYIYAKFKPARVIHRMRHLKAVTRSMYDLQSSEKAIGIFLIAKLYLRLEMALAQGKFSIM